MQPVLAVALAFNAALTGRAGLVNVLSDSSVRWPR